MGLNIDGIIFIGFLAVTIGIGLVSSRGINTMKQYAIGDRNFSTATIAATLVATCVSGSDFFTYLSEAYSNGLYFIWAAAGDVLCLLVVGVFFAPRLSEFLGKLSIAEAMGDLFGHHVRIITAVAGCIGTGGMIAVQLKVSGLLFEYCLGIKSIYGTLIGGTIVAMYSSIGGIRSVTFTDIIQLFTFGTIIPTVAFFILQTADLEVIHSTLKTNQLFDYKQVFDFTEPKSLTYLFLFFFIAVPGFGPAIFQRISMAKNTVQIRKSFVLASITSLFITFTMSWIGVMALSIQSDIEPNDIVKHIIFEYSYTGLKGLTLAGIMAMVMSTADSYVNSTSVLFVHDFCKPLGLKIAKNELILSRITSSLIVIFALLLALTGENLLNLIIVTNSFYLPIVTVPFILATLGFRSSSKSVLIAMTAGFVTVLVWKMFLQTEVVDSVIPGMMANLIFLIGSHYILKEPGGWVGIKDDTPLKLIRHERKVKIQKAINSLTKFNIKTFFLKNSLNSEAMYAFFGLFCIISIFSTMHTLPKEIHEQHQKVIHFIYPSVLFIATIFITYPLWLKPWKERIFIAIFWNISVFYVLIFSSFFMVLVSNFAKLQLMVFMLNLIVIAVLTRWKWALFLMITGLLITIRLFRYYFGIEYLSEEFMVTEYETTYLILLVSTILIIFLKPKQQYQELTEEKNKNLNGKIGFQEKQLREALALKSEFIRNISHEYHAPMTGITSMAQVLAESYEKLTDKQRKMAIDTIVESSRRLDVFDSNISALAALSKAGYELNLKTVNLSDLLYDRIDVCRRLYEENKEDREFIINIEDGIVLDLDENYLTQTIDNLLINAITYCKKGKITINLKHDASQVICTIEDEGIGIPRKELQDVFDEFTVSSKTHTPAGGRGVGLALCKRVIEVHDGRIWAESNGNKGAKFFLTVPYGKKEN